MKRLILIALTIASLILPYQSIAQTSVNGRILVGTLANRPVTCANGDHYTTNDQVPNVDYVCGPAGVWHSGSGGGSPGAGPVGTIQSTDGAGNLATSGEADNGITFSTIRDWSPKGPNPYTDVRMYGVRSTAVNVTPFIPGITATISLGSLNSAAISSASTFQTGDGVTVLGAGSACALTTPSAPTVTPSLAAAGTGTGIVVSANAGAGSNGYAIMARDETGCLTAVGSTGTTSTANSLGAQSVAVSGFTRSGNVVTATTSSAHGLVAGAHVIIATSLDNQYFGGSFTVASAPDTSHFTYATANDVADGAPAVSNAGGTVFWFNVNHLSWTPVTGATEYYIYGRASGSLTAIGVSRPQNAGQGIIDPTWDDFGSPMMDGITLPYFVPSTPSVSSLPHPLTTTICAGGGTANLTLCSAAITAVSGATILFDNAPNIITAAANTTNQSLLYFPSGSYVVNSYLPLTGAISVQLAGANLWLNDTMKVGSTTRIFGMLGSQGSSSVSFGWPSGGVITAARSNPGLWYQNGLSLLDGIQINGSTNGQLLMVLDAGSQGQLRNVNFVDSGSGDYMGMNLLARAGFWYKFDTVSFNTGPGQYGAGFTGTTATPAAFFNTGSLSFKQLSVQDRGIFFIPGPAGANVEFTGTSRAQGIITPFFTSYTTGGTTAGVYTINDVEIDTAGSAVIANMASNTAGSGITVTITSGISSHPTGGYTLSTGRAFGSISGSDGQNNSAINRSSFTNNVVNISGNGEFMYPIANAAAPTVGISAGGSFPVGNFSYVIVVIDINGNSSTQSGFVNFTTTTGNQTVTVTPPTAPAGAVGWLPYRCATNGTGCVLANVTPTCSAPTPISFSSTYVDNSSFGCNNGVPLINRAGAQTISQSGLSGTVFNLLNGGFKDVITTAATANRTALFPDASITVAGINIPQIISATQTFTNASQLRFLSTNGTNYAGFQGGASTSNLVWLFPTTDSSGTQCLSSNGSLQLAWSNCSAGSGTPGGSNTQVQYNAAGSFGGSTNLTWVSPTLTIGTAATSTGQLTLMNGGATGVGVTIQNNIATTAYNFNLPATAGTSGQPLLSGGGASSPMTFGNLGVPAGGTGGVTFTANQLLAGNGTSAFQAVTGTLIGTSPVLTLTSATAGNVAFALNTPASPTADIFDISINGTKTTWVDNAGVIHGPGFSSTGVGPAVIAGTEGSCPSPVSGQDIICLGDSGSHTAQLSNNGVTFKPIVQFTNTAPTAHGVVLATPTFPQVSTTAAGASGLPLVGQGGAADPTFTSLGVAGGGIGVVTITAHGVMIGEGTSAIAVAGPDATSNQFLASQGSGADPVFEAVPLGNSNSVSGVLNTANGGTGASSLSGASIATVTGVITTGHCADFSAATVLTDSGAPCGGGSSPARLDQITAATTSNTINSTVFPQEWDWALTGSTTAFKIGEHSAATGSSNVLFDVSTLTGSTAKVFQADNAGNGIAMSSSGILASIGSGSITANTLNQALNTTSPITGGGTQTSALTIGCATCAVTNSNNTFTAGTDDFTAVSILMATQSAGNSSTNGASTAFVTTAVSNAIAAVNPTTAVLAATTGSNLVGSYSNGSSGVGATFTITATGAFSLDGVSINAIGQRVLIKDQSSAFQNGVYIATTVGTTGVSAVFMRAADYNQPSNINSTSAIPIQSGTLNSETSWLITSTVVTMGTDSIFYAQLTVSPSITVTAASNFTSGDLIQAAGNNKTTSDSGISAAAIPFRVGASDVTGQSTSQSPVTLAASPTAAGYDIWYYADLNTACSTGGNSVSFTFNWTDATGARTAVTGSLSMAAGSPVSSAYLSGIIPLEVGSSNVTYSSTVAGACATGTSTYDVHAKVVRLQ